MVDKFGCGSGRFSGAATNIANQPKDESLEQQVLRMGRDAAVWLTGDPDEAVEITTTEIAFKAIKACLDAGEQRNSEANALRFALSSINPFSHTVQGDDSCLWCRRDRPMDAHGDEWNPEYHDTDCLGVIAMQKRKNG